LIVPARTDFSDATPQRFKPENKGILGVARIRKSEGWLAAERPGASRHHMPRRENPYKPLKNIEIMQNPRLR
jgi:hypothetical protein